MKELILDFAKWRCGGDKDGPNVLGKGKTQMLNKEGLYCCLGLFSKQLAETVSDKTLLGHANPYEVSQHLGVAIPLLSVEEEDNDDPADPFFSDTDLTDDAIQINDNPNTTSEEKIVKLQELFGEEGYSIKVINKP